MANKQQKIEAKIHATHSREDQPAKDGDLAHFVPPQLSFFFPYINFFIEKRGFFLFLCRTSHAFSCVAYGHMLLCSSNLLWSKIYGVCVWRETRRHCGLMFEYPVEFIVLLGSRQSSSYGLRVGTANPGFSDSQTRHVRKPT